MSDRAWTLHEGDCLGAEGMATLADKSVDHVICDPPYEAEAHTLQRRLMASVGVPAGGRYNNGAVQPRLAPLDFAPLDFATRKAVAVQTARLTRRWAVFFCQAEAVAAWRDAVTDAGLSYRRTMIWVKPDAQPQLSGDRPGMGYESLVAAHAPGRSKWNGGGRVGVYTINKNELDPHAHPTQKPIALMEALVRDFTDPGELVLDPFAGSGTTGVVCIRNGRHFIGWEKDPKYAAVARKRLEAAREQPGLFGSNGPRPRQIALPDPEAL